MSVRALLADYLLRAILVIGVPSLIAVKLHILPRRLNQIAVWGLGLCFLLLLVRLSLLAFGD